MKLMPCKKQTWTAISLPRVEILVLPQINSKSETLSNWNSTNLGVKLYFYVIERSENANSIEMLDNLKEVPVPKVSDKITHAWVTVLSCIAINVILQGNEFWFHFVIIVAWEIYLLRLLSISFNTFNLDSFAISLYLKIILKISTILEETKVKSIWKTR